MASGQTGKPNGTGHLRPFQSGGCVESATAANWQQWCRGSDAWKQHFWLIGKVAFAITHWLVKTYRIAAKAILSAALLVQLMARHDTKHASKTRRLGRSDLAGGINQSGCAGRCFTRGQWLAKNGAGLGTAACETGGRCLASFAAFKDVGALSPAAARGPASGTRGGCVLAISGEEVASLEQSLHLADRPLQADKDGAGNNAVADVQFQHSLNRGNGADVVVVEPMPRMESQT
jgi:hypothetical protein